MSTKIYYGFKFNHNDAVLAYKQLKEFQTRYVNWVYDDIYRYTEKTLSDVNKVIESNTDETNNALREIYSFEIGLAFFEDKILGISFHNHNNAFHMLLENEYISGYGYWDNTDPPDNVPEKEFYSREKDWEFLGYEPVSKSLFIFPLIHKYDLSLMAVYLKKNNKQILE